MIVADKLKKTNRAEYLLYMWQVEDIIRAYHCDSDRIAQEYISQFNLPPETRKATEDWYANLCEMMRSEGKKEHGHLQICTNILQELCELHANLIKNAAKFPYYREMYYKVLPYIVELRGKNQNSLDKNLQAETSNEPELQTCFDLLYGVMMLRLQKKHISDDTAHAVKDISTLLGQLSDYYFKDKKEPLDFND